MTNMWGTAICQPMRTDFPSCFALGASAGRSLSCGMFGLEPERGGGPGWGDDVGGSVAKVKVR